MKKNNPIPEAPFRPQSFAPAISSDSPINVNIHIECETEAEVLAHLSVLRAQLKRAFKKAEESALFTVSDNNCYGTHYAQVNQDL